MPHDPRERPEDRRQPATWAPVGYTGSVSDLPDSIWFVRRVVTNAVPRTSEEASVGLRRCWQFVTWALAEGLTLDDTTLFAAGNVTRFKQTIKGPTMTRNAVGSILRRLDPDLGFAGTTRKPTDKPKRWTENADVRQIGERRLPLAADVAAVIERYVPARLPAERWEPIAELVRQVVTITCPASQRRAKTLLREVAYLAAWVHGEHRPMVPTVVLAGRTIEDFLDVLTAGRLPVRTVASFASNLHAVREAFGIPLKVTRRQFPAAAEKDPYNTFEIDRVFALATRIPTRNRRRHATAALDLMFGVGAKPNEVAEIEPDHVNDTCGIVSVTLTHPVRTVEVLPDYVAGIRAAVAGARAAGDRFLVGGAAEVRSKRLLSLLDGKAWKVDVDTRRTRATWIVEASATPGFYAHVLDLLEATGLRTLARINELLPHIAARRNELTGVLVQPAAPAEDFDDEADDDVRRSVAS